MSGPWTSFKLDWPSSTENESKDIVSKYIGEKWSQAYLAGKETSPYAEAFLAPADWWRDSEVEQLLTVAGADELLIDPIKAWSDKYRVSVRF